MSEIQDSLSTIAGELAVTSPAYGAGALAAGVVELAAALCEAIARASLDIWTEGRGAATQARTVRARSGEAARANARAYTTARDALAQRPDPGKTGRDAALRAALVAAADTLLTIAAVGADCASLAAEIAAHCEPALRVDAAGAAELAAAAARSAAALVDINLALLPGDERREGAVAIADYAEAGRSRAQAAVDEG